MNGSRGVAVDPSGVPIRQGHTPDVQGLDMYIIINRALRGDTGEWEDVVGLEQVCLFQDDDACRLAGEPMHAVALLRVAGTNDPGEQADLKSIAAHFAVAVYSEDTHDIMGFAPSRGSYNAQDPFLQSLAEPAQQL